MERNSEAEIRNGHDGEKGHSNRSERVGQLEHER